VADSLGLSFLPGGDGTQDPNGQSANIRRPSPVQTAIQTLALRLPRTVGASAGAPQALLQGAGGAGLGNPNAALMLEQLRRRLFPDNSGVPSNRYTTWPGMPRSTVDNANAGGVYNAPPLLPSMPNIGFINPTDPTPESGGANVPAPSAPTPQPQPSMSSGPMPIGPRDRRI
jgi:hypothetical protein